MPLIRQPKRIAFQQLFFDQLLTWPTDQPRHATRTDNDPVETYRPLNPKQNPHFIVSAIRSETIERIAHSILYGEGSEGKRFAFDGRTHRRNRKVFGETTLF